MEIVATPRMLVRDRQERLRTEWTRSAFLTLAFTALALLLLRPVCDALAAQGVSSRSSSVVMHGGAVHSDQGHGIAHSPACCVAIEDGVPLKPLATANSGADGRWTAPYLPFAYLSAAVQRLRRDSAPDAFAPPPASYYARSARIQR